MSLYSLVSYTDDRFQGSNLTDDLRARGLPASLPIRKIYDYGVGVGGPIRRDKIWLFTAHRWWGSQQNVGSFFNATQDTWAYTPDVSRPAYTDPSMSDNNARVTWQVTGKNKLNLYYGNQRNCQCLFGVGVDRAPEAAYNLRYAPNYIAQATWSYPATNRLLVESGVSYLNGHSTIESQSSVVRSRDVAVTELSTNVRYKARVESLNASEYGDRTNVQSNQRFSVSYVTGSHAMKVGLYAVEAESVLDTDPGDVSYQFRFGVPQALTQWAQPHYERERIMPLMGLYAQDQWTLKRLTFNLGVRYDSVNSYIPADDLPASRFLPARSIPRIDNVPAWKDVSPRLGVAYDLFGNGKTAVKATVGRYVQTEGIGTAAANHPENLIAGSTTRTWADTNANFTPDCDLRLSTANGECGAMSNTRFGQTVNTTRYQGNVLKGWSARQFNWQTSVQVQHEIIPGVGVAAGYFRTTYGNFTAVNNLAVTPDDYQPYCVTAPTDARVPVSGQQVCGLYDVRPAVFGQVNNEVFLVDAGRQSDVFNGIDVGLNARFGKSILSGGVSSGQTVTNPCEALADSPDRRFCRTVLPWRGQTQFKLSGSRPLPFAFQFSGTYQNLPGIPVAANSVFTNAQIAPSLGRNLSAGANATVVVELMEPNTRFEKRVTQLDLRLSRTFSVNGFRLQGMFDAYNVLNASPVLSMTTRLGPQYLRPGSILAARLFKLGVQLDF